MENRRGFTMVELLATITILGILTVITVGSVSFMIRKSKENYYTSQRNNLIAAAKSYYQANKSLLPRDIGMSSEVTYQTLKKEKYIGTMYASDKTTECIGKDTKVIVTMTDKNKYKYEGFLHCGDKNDGTKTDSDTITYSVSFNKKGDNPLVYNLTITPKDSSKNAIIQSYSYTITKNQANYVGPITEKVNAKTVNTKNFSIDLSEVKKDNNFVAYVNIVYKTNGKSRTTTAQKTLFVGDRTAPSYSIWTDTDKWTHGPQTIKVTCDDKQGDDDLYVSRCQEDVYKIVIKNKKDAHKYAKGITIYDKAGNGTFVALKNTIKVDFDPPTCPTVTGYSKGKETNYTSPSGLTPLALSAWNNKWLKDWLFIRADGSKDQFIDSIGGVDGVYYLVTVTGASENVKNLKQEYRNINKENVSTITYQACDGLNNCTDNCGSYTVKLDRTAPDCGGKTGESTTWQNLPSRTVGITCNKGWGADCTSSNFTAVVPDETQTKNVSISIADSAGNSRVCTNNYNIYLDRTPPNIFVTPNDSWYYSLTATAADYLSQIKEAGWSSFTYRGSLPSYSESIQGTTNYGERFFYARDWAGNENVFRTKAYKVFDRLQTNSDSRAYKVQGIREVDGKKQYSCEKNAKYGKGDEAYYRPWKQFNFDFWNCNCTYDYYRGDFYSYNSNNKVTGTSAHSSHYMTIFYRNNDNGVKACKAELPRNSYVYDVCWEGTYPVNSAETTFHGYRWYNEAVPSGGYSNWQTTAWYHDNHYKDNRVAYSSTTGQACKHSCQIAGDNHVYKH